MHYLSVFAALYILGSPQGLALWWGHALAAIFALIYLYKISQSYIFWILLPLALFTASEPRFSLEYLFLFSGFLAWSLSPWWQNLAEKKRKIFLLICFILFYLADLLKLSYCEKGSLVLWFPVFLALYFVPKFSATYSLSALALIFSNKKTALLAFIASLMNKVKTLYLVLLAAILVIVPFFFLEQLPHFVKTSVLSRIYIWHSCLQGFLSKPIWGHGLGTFAIDFPPYRSHIGVYGARVTQQVAHGHNLLMHILFEQGLVGLALLVLFFYLVYKYARAALLPLLVISFFDAALVMYNQYLLASLILFPFISQNKANLKINPRLIPSAKILSYIVALAIFIPSLIGHYYYDHRNLDKAIQWDKYNGLYYFVRGADRINRDSEASEKDLEQAIKLCPSVSYFYGFLAAAKLANNKIPEAQSSIAKALVMDGGDAYWYVISAFSNYQDHPEIFKEHYAKAIEIKPEIEELLHDPNYTATEFIGAKRSDARINAFYRTGLRVYLPMPYLP